MLWSRKKPLNQPPTYGRVGYVQEKRAERELEKAAERALTDAQLDRNRATLRQGGRAVVVD